MTIKIPIHEEKSFGSVCWAQFQVGVAKYDPTHQPDPFLTCLK